MADFEYNFSGRDFTARFEALIARMRQDVPELTDLNHSDAGISILRLVADTVDKLNFYIDEAFAEGFIETARFKQSLIDIAKTVDILPKLASPARTTLRISRLEGVTGAITVPKYSSFTRADGVIFLTDVDVTLLAGQASIDVNATQGELVTYTLDPEDFTISTLTNRAMYNLGVNVAARTITVQHGSPIEMGWSEADGFWRSKLTDRHFILELFAEPEPINDEVDTVFLVLGDGTQGMQLPPETMTVTFIRTDGPIGNCGSGTITVVPPAFTEILSCTNTVSATGGAYAEGIEDFRRRIPRVVRTQRRGVVAGDYEALIESVAGIKHCQAVDRNWRDQWPHMYMVLFAVPEGGGAMSNELRETVFAQLESWGHFGNWRERYILSDATPVSVAVTCRIGITPGNVGSTVAAAVQAAIENLFTVEHMDIQGTLSYTTLHQTVSAVTGVSWVEFSSPIDSVSAGIGEILTAGTITITPV
jgi:uncharacterized phage protein gp47/JayE